MQQSRLRAVHDFMVLGPQLRSESGTKVTFVKDLTVMLADLDAYLAPVVTWLSNAGTYKAGYH